MEEQKFYAAAIIMAGLAANVAYQDYSTDTLARLAASGAKKLYETLMKEHNGD